MVQPSLFVLAVTGRNANEGAELASCVVGCCQSAAFNSGKFESQTRRRFVPRPFKRSRLASWSGMMEAQVSTASLIGTTASLFSNPLIEDEVARRVNGGKSGEEDRMKENGR
ncbi:hypothetical protein [Bradyrhizobium sp. WD16]|uniref:hypothetical protein n=1 Tax=Bradyrhizobium sp. WD16 TaxID=1521768 RepID=UPI0020A4A84E|nr:hypothetical protein [Bradyrhizobium sp. WD16]